MTERAPAPRSRTLLYAILGGIIAATIPFYCSAVFLIILHPTPTQNVTPSYTAPVIPTRQFPLPATPTPPLGPQLTFTPTHTAFTPPTPTLTPIPSETPRPTHTRAPPPTDTPPPTATPTDRPDRHPGHAVSARNPSSRGAPAVRHSEVRLQ